MRKIYVVQDLNYNDYSMLYVGEDKEKANDILANYKYNKYLYGCIWENGKEIKSDIKEFKYND